MKILALETTETAATLAAMEDGTLCADQTLPPLGRSAQTLAPALRDLLHEAAWRPHDVGLVAVSQGPGSFTGLRVGVTTAKIFAYAVGAEVLGIDTLRAIAAGLDRDLDAAASDGFEAQGDSAVPLRASTVAACVDAQRGDVVGQIFSRGNNGALAAIGPAVLQEAEAWFAAVPPGALVVGPALRRFAACLPRGIVVAPQDSWAPRAAVVGQLAWAEYRAGRRDDLWTLAPIYSRVSAAEERRRAKATS